jgi:glycosyltransferase involved in cell wall biosynthesis
MSDQRQKVTAIIPAGNEAHQIREAIASVSWADEILVAVDAASTDGTAEAAAREGSKVRVLVHEYVYSAAQKNWAIPQASHDWVFLLDADERVPPVLAGEVKDLLNRGPEHDAYWIYRDNVLLGRRMRFGGQRSDSVIRLFRKKCRYQDREVHAEIEGYASCGTLKGRIGHDTFRSWEHYLRKLDRYTTWGARQDHRDGKGAGFVNVALRPVHRFFKQYLFRLGFLDGIPGAVSAYLGAYGVFLKYAKLWHLRRGGRLEG